MIQRKLLMILKMDKNINIYLINKNNTLDLFNFCKKIK